MLNGFGKVKRRFRNTNMTDTTQAAQATAVQGAVDEHIELYIAVRAKIKQLDAAHEKSKEKYVDVLNRINGWLTSFLDSAKVDSVKTKYGTAYTTTRHTASLADPEAFMKFVTENGLFDLLNRSANPSAVKDYVEEHKQLPPGCNLNAIRTIGVRKKSGGTNAD